MAVGLNVDTIFVTKYLKNTDAARTGLVSAATTAHNNAVLKATVNATGGDANAKDPEAAAVANAMARVSDLNLPIGWTKVSFQTAQKDWLLTAIGWLLTAFAISLGAPFWFDTLNNIMVIRSTVKPSEKSPDKGSDEPAKH